MDLSGRHLILGMTGGIAAYKACELVRRLRDEGATVRVVMTRAAQEFVTPTTMQALSGQPVFTDQWGIEGGRVDNAMPHIDLTRGADAIVVAPASAHFLAKTAQGLADDLLSTLVLARACPLLVAPAMNVEMWTNAATQRNVRLLRDDGVLLLGPGEGAQACGETGSGRMLEPHELLADIIAFFQPRLLQGRRVLMTAGPTFEPIDPVRGITNLSSGKMGFALARAAREAGAEVILVAGPTALATPRGVRRIDVQTATQMQAAVMAELAGSDIFIGVAAVADWRVANARPRCSSSPTPTSWPASQRARRGRSAWVLPPRPTTSCPTRRPSWPPSGSTWWWPTAHRTCSVRTLGNCSSSMPPASRRFLRTASWRRRAGWWPPSPIASACEPRNTDASSRAPGSRTGQWRLRCLSGADRGAPDAGDSQQRAVARGRS
jgi:phosphopantothenoylcysteine decarboxylase/phosphopantothenate--cysteine ligase